MKYKIQELVTTNDKHASNLLHKLPLLQSPSSHNIKYTSNQNNELISWYLEAKSTVSSPHHLCLSLEFNAFRFILKMMMLSVVFTTETAIVIIVSSFIGQHNNRTFEVHFLLSFLVDIASIFSLEDTRY